MPDRTIVRFSYKNHKGEVSSRIVRPIRIWFGSTAWHTNPCWLMEGFDLEKLETRDYQVCSILGDWEEYTPVERCRDDR